jgi:MoxR-like ATPase
VARLVRRTRPSGTGAGTGTRTDGGQNEVTRWIRWGAGPRAGQFLVLGAKAHALLKGRLHVTAADIARVATPVLRHRILLNFQAEAEGRTAEELIESLLRLVPPPSSGLS